jgi:hypothetical protein
MSKALVPIEQKTVSFYEDQITAVLMDVDGDEVVYVPIRPLCDHLGLSWQGQNDRIRRDLVLSEIQMSVRVTRMDIEEGSRRPHTSEMLCLPLEFLNGWLFGVNASRVKSDVRDRLIRYQRECYRVLADAFQGSAVLANAPSTLIQVREMGLAIVRMAEEQMAFDRRLGATEGELRVVTERLTAVEQQLFPGDPVTQSQAMQVSQAVKAVAIVLGKKTGRNEFGAIYGELYRRYGITSYKALPARKFEDAMTLLTEWHQSVVTNTPF